MCVHMFSCSCADAHLHSTVCKHSHIVQVTMINQPSEVLPNDDQVPSEDFPIDKDNQDLYEDLVFLARNNNDLDEDSPVHLSHDEVCTFKSPDTTEYFARVLQSVDRITHLHGQKSLLKDKIHELLLLVDEVDNPDGITTAMRHVNTGIHSLKAMMNPQENIPDFPTNKRPASNANHQMKPRFFSTKKKRVVPKRWAKPSRDERDTCYDTLENVEILHCGVCFKQDDMDTSDTIEWIQCSACNIWVHKSCIDSSDDDDFICRACHLQ